MHFQPKVLPFGTALGLASGLVIVPVLLFCGWVGIKIEPFGDELRARMAAARLPVAHAAIRRVPVEPVTVVGRMSIAGTQVFAPGRRPGQGS